MKKGRVARRAAITLVAVGLIAAGCVRPPTFPPETPLVDSGGSHWAAHAADQWRADVSRHGIRVNYESVGSPAGRNFLIINQVDFAVSELPFQRGPGEDELERAQAAGIGFDYLPFVAGGVALMYNLTDAAGQPVTNLQLSANTIAGIFTGAITKWNSPLIQADNPGVLLPARDIVPVLRSDEAGTSAELSSYLSATSPNIWGVFASSHQLNPPDHTVDWPAFPGSVSYKGSDGVANFIHNDSTGGGSIGYVEPSYAQERARPVSKVKNESGNYVLPTAPNMTAALWDARLRADHTHDLSSVYTSRSENAYPISNYAYMIVRTSGPRTDASIGSAIARFVYYSACTGQAKVDRLGYAPFSWNLMQFALDAVKGIPGSHPPPTLSDCVQSAAQGKNIGTVHGAVVGSPPS